MPPQLLRDPLSRALHLATRQDGVLLTRQARELGVTDWQLKGLQRAAPFRVTRGAIVIPPVLDPVRSSARAGQLLVPASAISYVSAARLSGLEGLGYWDPQERVDLTLDRARTRWQRAGVRLHFSSLATADMVDRRGLRLTSPARTLLDCSRVLNRADYVSVADSALRQGLLDDSARLALSAELLRRGLRDAAGWLGLASAGGESPSETRVRLILIDAGLAPDWLQYNVFTEDGFPIARLDMAWTRHGRKVGLEVQSQYHDLPEALYHDRDKLNALHGLAWDVRQVTQADANRRPRYIVQQVREALGEA